MEPKTKASKQLGTIATLLAVVVLILLGVGVFFPPLLVGLITVGSVVSLIAIVIAIPVGLFRAISRRGRRRKGDGQSWKDRKVEQPAAKRRPKLPHDSTGNCYG
jgi:amino acid transporter